MDEIKENEFVRTKDGIIDKIFKFDEILNEYWCEKGLVIDPENKIGTHLKDIVNHSFNIKELIEEGDIVNESLIVYKGKVASGKEKLLVGNHIINGMPLEVANIKTILTKEQYERNCYRLENNEC